MNNPPDDLDAVFKALSDPTRRQILDFLKGSSRLTGEIVDQFPQLSRFGVMKHMDVLRDAGLMLTQHEGRQRINSLNAIPIQQVYERWMTPFSAYWARSLMDIKDKAEKEA